MWIATRSTLVRTLDHQLIEALCDDARQALGHFSDQELAILLADKRLRDYKQALSQRDVCDTKALGMTAWIIHHDRHNHSVMETIPDFEQLLATYLTGHLAEDLSRPGRPLPLLINLLLLFLLGAKTCRFLIFLKMLHLTQTNANGCQAFCRFALTVARKANRPA